MSTDQPRWFLGIWALAGTVAVTAVTTWLAYPTTSLQVSGHPAWWLASLACGLAGAGLRLRYRHESSERLARQHQAETAAAASAASDQAGAAAEEDRARLLRRLDHELKNPLTALRVSLSTAARQEPDTLASAIEAAVAQTDRLVRLVADLRKVTDIRTMDLDLEQVDIGALLADVHRTMEGSDPPRTGQRNWSVQVPSVPWPLPKVEADAGLIFLAVHNLAENAVKYSRPDDRIELRGMEENGGGVVEVADTGLGISAEEHQVVWAELGRGRATAASVAGSGIGLALVAAIAHRHGGSVALRSRPGWGTAVRIWLPLHRPPTPIRPPLEVPPPN